MTFTIKDLGPALATIGDQALESLQIVSAAQVATQYYPHFDPGQPALLLGFTNRAEAQRVQQVLLMAYPADHAVTLISEGTKQTVPLASLTASTDLDFPCHLLIPALPTPASYAALQDVVARLRAPGGCPWDRALTWAKLRAFLLEESYELLAALDAEDVTKVAEEQGDLLLQIALQTQIATEKGLFRWPDVIHGIVDKLIRRHPHVFGDVKVNGTEDVLANWEAIKRAERESHGEARSPLAGVPKGLPALAQADAYLDRISRLQKLDVPDAPWAILEELPADAPVTPEMVGKALFGLVAWARDHGVDAESALRVINARYAAQIA